MISLLKTIGFFFTILFLSISGASAAEMTAAEALVAKTIKDAGAVSDVNHDLRVDLVQGKSSVDNLTGDLQVTKIEFDTKTGRFTAFISSNNNLPLETAGRFFETVKLPVVTRKLSKDEIISREDIAYLEVETSKVRDNFITNAEELVGKSVTRQVYKARPIAATQISEAKVVKRNNRLTMVYNNNSLKIQDSGIALEDGSIGQTIKIKNANSSRIVTAKIVGPEMAEVQSINAILASN